ncbi:GAF domain-containing sensor histidine kinase [Nodosilinea nodulosa]|uniref:GAF domain-containing sensor histidine kinase n=1 Tax=Nodosilinea nodulosa TaxID=416001 RepID=UPI0018C249CC|nr:GAF domain-containing sensor histidine kinase [Nodosilinea nodulosa]
MAFTSNPLSPDPADRQDAAIADGRDRMLQRRDQLLEAAAAAANLLLTLENLDEAIDTALNLIAAGAGCDRINVLENAADASSTVPDYYTVLYEWTSPGTIRQATHSETARISSAGIEAFMEEYYLHGDGFGGLLEDWIEPLRSAYAAVQVKSSYSVPIRVNGRWWGVLCFNYCREAICISPAEVAILRTIADFIGSAIQRDRITREQQESAQRQALELEKANHVLKQTVDLLVTESDLNRFLDHVLKALSEQFDAPLIQYWEHPEPGNISYLRLACSNGKILTVADLPDDCFVRGIQIPPELIGYENLHTRKRHFVVEDVPADPIQQSIFSPLNFDLETWCTENHIRKMINIPLMRAGKTTGALLLYFPSGHYLSEQQTELMHALAQLVTLAIQLTQLAEIKQAEAIAQAQEQVAQERVAELVKANTALKQSLDTLAADPDLDRFIGHLLKLIADQFDAPAVEYWVHATQAEPETNAYVHLACWQGKIFRHLPEQHPDLDLIPFLSLLLSVSDTTIGALVIYLPSHSTVSGQVIELAHALAQQLTLAIELTRLAEEAQQAALLQERARMAREIHDTLAQAFGGILMQLQAATYFTPTQLTAAQNHVMTAQALARDGLAEARRSVWTLYLETAEYEDLSRTIAKFIAQTASGQPVPISLDIEGIPYRLHPDLGLNLLRIAQESVTNALRHAQAQTISIGLSYQPHTLQLIIRDDGCGFDSQPSSWGFGLLGMQQRTARLRATWQLVSQLGQGTTITVTLANPAIL